MFIRDSRYFSYNYSKISVGTLMKSIRFRIIVLSTFALIFLGLAIFKEYDNIEGNLINAQKSLEVINKTAHLSQIVYFLQQERGLSAANLAKNDVDIRNKLLKQRQITDSRLKDLIDFIDANDKKKLETFEKELQEIRQKIDTGTASWDIVKQFYTEKIEQVLDQIHISVGSLDHAKEITHKLDSICNLAYAREDLGLLRATISRYYQKGSLTTSESLDISQRYFDFESRYKTFQLDQSDSDFNNLKNRIETDVFYSVNNQIQSILKKENVSHNSTTVQWWSESTLVIDTMFEVEKDLLNQIQEYSQNTISKNERDLFIYSLSAIAVFFIISLLTILTVSRMLQALSILIYSLHKVEQTEDFGIRIKTKSNDEFGQIGFSINHLLDYTEKIIKQKDELASIDVLTGIMNRRSFMTLVNKEVARSRRYETPLSLIFCDIDKFKSINDNYGHSIGDEVLQAFAHSIKSHIRQSDLFARWGGEEFIILAVETDESNASQLADNLRKIIMELKVQPVKQITCSFGVAELKKDESFEQLCERADQAVYDAKNSGRNQVCISQE